MRRKWRRKKKQNRTFHFVVSGKPEIKQTNEAINELVMKTQSQQFRDIPGLDTPGKLYNYNI